jgi:hypothetical protein
MAQTNVCAEARGLWFRGTAICQTVVDRSILESSKCDNETTGELLSLQRSVHCQSVSWMCKSFASLCFCSFLLASFCYRSRQLPGFYLSARLTRVTGRGHIDINRISGYLPGKIVFFLMQVRGVSFMEYASMPRLASPRDFASCASEVSDGPDDTAICSKFVNCLSRRSDSFAGTCLACDHS